MTTTTAKRHRMRCNACRRSAKGDASARFTLRRAPHLYVRAVRCPVCKSDDVVSIEAIRRRELAKQEPCECGVYPFKHRAGSLRFCAQNPRATEPETEEDMYQYEACLRTARGG